MLVTGSTGFVGSALIANLLAGGARVIAVARNDAIGTRTLEAVRDAAAGFGLSLSKECEERLTVLDVEYQDIEAGIPARLLESVSTVWHTAAEMSYANQKLFTSYQTNVVNTVQLYRHVAAHAPQCRRFAYVSTAYVAGMLGGRVAETLHAGPPYVNVYQVTKGAAEHALAQARQEAALPLTIFRPTIVVGHRNTCWARRNGFGFYMFVEAIASAGKAGMESLRLHLNPHARPDLVSIDALVHDALHLSRQPQECDLDIYHCSGGLGCDIDEVMTAIGDACGVEIVFGEPQTAADRRIDRAVHLNRAFANTEWMFDRARLDAALGTAAYARLRAPVTMDDIGRMAKWYAEVDAGDDAPALLPLAEPMAVTAEADEIEGVPLS
jgi:nucleoside-diphosphate-sugar epimerase